jgi:serine/threonine protein kinase
MIKTIAGYTLIAKLGEGTFSTAYLAQNAKDNQVYCVKVYKHIDG